MHGQCDQMLGGIKSSPIFLQSCIASNVAFSITPNIWATLARKLVVKPFNINPVWSHWTMDNSANGISPKNFMQLYDFSGLTMQHFYLVRLSLNPLFKSTILRSFGSTLNLYVEIFLYFLY